MKTLLQRYEAETEDNTDLNEASSLSYLDHMASLDSEQARAEVAQRATSSKQHVEKLLQYMEKSGTRVMVPRTGVFDKLGATFPSSHSYPSNLLLQVELLYTSTLFSARH